MTRQMSLLADQRLAGCRAGVGRVLSSVAAGHPGRTRSALDRFRETSIVDRRVRGDVPPHPRPSGERLFSIFSVKPRLGPVAAAVTASAAGATVLHPGLHVPKADPPDPDARIRNSATVTGERPGEAPSVVFAVRPDAEGPGASPDPPSLGGKMLGQCYHIVV